MQELNNIWHNICKTIENDVLENIKYKVKFNFSDNVINKIKNNINYFIPKYYNIVTHNIWDNVKNNILENKINIEIFNQTKKKFIKEIL